MTINRHVTITRAAKAHSVKTLLSGATLALLLAMSGCGDGSGGDPGGVATPTPTPAPSATPTSQAVGVTGTRLTLDGAIWLSRGVTLRAFDSTPAYAQANLPAQYRAYQAYQTAADTEYAAAKSYGADTVRFLVSQVGLDPQATGSYDAAYAASVTAAVQTARSKGFVVVVAIQDEPDSGEPAAGHQPLATAATQRDLDALVATFKGDRGVVFDLYNEPTLPKSAANWSLWLNGDPTGTSTAAPNAIGMQALVTRLRQEGSTNVLVVDGLEHAHTLDGAPAIADPLGRVVYAIHPYLNGSADESGWDTDYGNPATLLPVWADEWSANTGSPASGATLGLGNLPTYQPAVDLVNYLQTHSISLCTGAFDQPPFVVLDVPGWTMTSSYNGYMAGVSGGGSGQLVHVLFATNYALPMTAADGLR